MELVIIPSRIVLACAPVSLINCRSSDLPRFQGETSIKTPVLPVYMG